jgi:hypothetical protein
MPTRRDLPGGDLMGRHEDFATVNDWLAVVRGIQFGTRGRVAGRIIKNVCWALALYANPDGSRIRPGSARLAFECEVDPATLRRVLGILKDAGLIEVVVAAKPTRGKAGSPQLVDVYQLTVADGVRESRRVVCGEPLVALDKAAAKLAIVELASGERGRYTPKHDAKAVQTATADPGDLPVQTATADNHATTEEAGAVCTETLGSAVAVCTDLPVQTATAYPLVTPQGSTTSQKNEDAPASSGALAVVLRHPTGEVAPILDAQTITGAWIDHCAANNVKLPRNLIGRYAKGIKTALDQGFDADLIKRALARMLADGQASWPGSFDAYLVRVQQAAVAAPRQRRLGPGEDSARRLLAGEEPGQVIDAVNRFFERGAS